MARAQKLYTLTEVSKETGISMPTLQRYKKLHQKRIPSVGEGRRQRYPRKALAVFKQIKNENLKKRGRPAAASKSGRKAKAGSARKTRKGRAKKSSRKGDEGGLLTLLEIGRRTGISYPTLLRYVRIHGKKIPHVGKGRRRRYPVEAVAVFRDIRKSSKRGPRVGKPRAASARGTATGRDQALTKRIRELETAQRKVTEQLDEILELLKQPMKITVHSD